MVETIRFVIVRWFKAQRRAICVSSLRTDNSPEHGRLDLSLEERAGTLIDLPAEWTFVDVRHVVAIKTGVPPEAIAVCEVVHG